MRLGAHGVVSSQPLGTGLPAMLRADDFCSRFVDGLDEVLAPILLTIDNLDAYVDPEVAPLDFVAWLASWFSLELDPTWDEQRCRRTVAALASLSRRRGTASALVELVELLGDRSASVAVADGGGVWTSATPDATLPGDGDGAVVVTGAVAERHRRLLAQFCPPGKRIVLEPA